MTVGAVVTPFVRSALGGFVTSLVTTGCGRSQSMKKVFVSIRCTLLCIIAMSLSIVAEMRYAINDHS